MTYNLTTLQQGGNMADLAIWANDATSQMLFGLFIFAIAIVMFMSLRRYAPLDALLTSSFVCLILSFVARSAGLVSFYIVTVFLIATAGLAFYKFYSEP